MFRVSEAADAPHLTGPEMQVLDNAHHPDGANPLSSAGACYGLYPPSQDVTRPAGAWNDVRIVANGARVEHWMNGVEDRGIRDRQPRLAGAAGGQVRSATSPTYGREPRGHIAAPGPRRIGWPIAAIKITGPVNCSEVTGFTEVSAIKRTKREGTEVEQESLSGRLAAAPMIRSSEIRDLVPSSLTRRESRCLRALRCLYALRLVTIAPT